MSEENIFSKQPIFEDIKTFARDHLDNMKAAYEKIVDMQDEIMIAFIAKYKMQPEEVVINQVNHLGGDVSWFISKRGEGDV